MRPCVPHLRDERDLAAARTIDPRGGRAIAGQLTCAAGPRDGRSREASSVTCSPVRSQSHDRSVTERQQGLFRATALSQDKASLISPPVAGPETHVRSNEMFSGQKKSRVRKARVEKEEKDRAVAVAFRADSWCGSRPHRRSSTCADRTSREWTCAGAIGCSRWAQRIVLQADVSERRAKRRGAECTIYKLADAHWEDNRICIHLR